METNQIVVIDTNGFSGSNVCIFYKGLMTIENGQSSEIVKSIPEITTNRYDCRLYRRLYVVMCNTRDSQ
ncbi:unnamed protein product [Macrosiphum euphorbiae]|uniref:Uncharacterized protein n=1 Tax=Macrosiphum euphorbiae TaxID=13131 RepID=A0AAV0W1A5_9HEMI|nr:unnamed protein product [Macrosiphum euphorbiae]